MGSPPITFAARIAGACGGVVFVTAGRGVPPSMADVIRACADQDLDEILEVINDAARAYRGVIPDDRVKAP